MHRQCDGLAQRSRSVKVHGVGAGGACVGPTKETKACQSSRSLALDECAPAERVDCEFSDWTTWSVCPVKCGGGAKTRARNIVREPQGGGRGCEASTSEVAGCNLEPCNGDCEAKPCLYEDWGEWGACDKCGGERMRSRGIKQHASCFGEPCKPEASQEADKCPRQCHDSVYCAWQDWNAWSACEQTCGKGVRSRARALMMTQAPATTKAVQVLAHIDDAEAQRIEQLRQRFAGLESRRVMDLTVAFGCGGLSLLVGFLVVRALRAASSAGERTSQHVVRRTRL